MFLYIFNNKLIKSIHKSKSLKNSMYKNIINIKIVNSSIFNILDLYKNMFNVLRTINIFLYNRTNTHIIIIRKYISLSNVLYNSPSILIEAREYYKNTNSLLDLPKF